MKLPAMLTAWQKVFCLCCITAFFLPVSTPGQDLVIRNLTGTRGGNLVLSLPSGPSSFNRMYASGLANAVVCERLSAGLVHINRENWQLEPSLATHWNVDKSGKIYTVYLRRGVRFSDGSPFTAEDALFSLQVLTDPRTHNMLASQIEIDGSVPLIKKIDNFTLQIVFKRPVGMGLRMLDSIPILPKKYLSRAYQEGRLDSAWGPNVNPSEVVGLGPFRLKEYQPNIRLVLERNSYYWKKDSAGKQLPYLEFITFLIIPDVTSEALRFRQGELDIVRSPSLTAESYASLRRTQNNYTMRDLGAGLQMDYLWFNLNRGANSAGKPLVDPEKRAVFEKREFRQAISCALDRAGMIRSILLGLGEAQYGLVSSGNVEWYNGRINKTEYNPARARELLTRAGLRDQNNDGILEYGEKRRPLELTLLTSRGNSLREKTAEVIQENLAKIGIRVTIQAMLPNEIASRFLKSFDYDAILFGFTPTDVAPDLQTDLWYSSGSIHFWNPGQKNPAFEWESRVDSLILSLVTSLDPKVRKGSFDEAQSIWASELPAIPTIAPNILVGWNNKLGNLKTSVLAPHLEWNAEEITKEKP